MEGIPGNPDDGTGFRVPETTIYCSPGLASRTAPTPKAVIENLTALHKANTENARPVQAIEQSNPEGE